MHANETIEMAEILHRVETWPQPMRLKLAQQILQSLEKLPTQEQSKTRRGRSAAEVMAMLKSNKPAPDDATTKQWLDEYRMEKYGQ
jgi:hypothetical protein